MGQPALPETRTVKVEREDGVTWVILNRPEKRNAMSVQLNADMLAVLTALEADPETRVLVLTGAGEAFSAGMDLRDYFRYLDEHPEEQRQAQQTTRAWQHHKLRFFPRPTIAAVNGWCFGGAFSPLTSCDLAIAAEEATFGLSEVNWGIIPGGLVSRDVALVMGYREALYYIMTGKPFDAHRAREVGLVNEVVPGARLRERVMELARDLMKLSPEVLRIAKETFKHCLDMPYEQAEDYLAAKIAQLRLIDREHTRERGMEGFLDRKSYRPGLGPVQRP